MSKAKLMAAQELIKEKRYDEALALLKGVDHPTAKQWLDKLDKIVSKQGKPHNPTKRNVKLNTLQKNIGASYSTWKIIGLVATIIIFFTIISITLLMINSVSDHIDVFVGIWGNQYGATITYRPDGTGVSNGGDTFAYKIVDKIGDAYLIENVDTGNILYGNTSIYVWRVISNNEIILEFSAPADLYTPGMSIEELKELNNEFDILAFGEISEPLTWKLITRLTD